MDSNQEAPKRALIYTRISRDATGEKAGVKRQEEDCRKLADLRRFEVVGHESDNSISAYGEKVRPGWERTLAAIEAGEVDVLVCYHIDRLTRSMNELERLIILSERTGVGVLTVTGDVDLTSDMGRMIARILAAVARQEVERKGARQKRANQDRASQGLPWGSGWRPFGFTKEMEQVPVEADLIRKAAADVLDGASLKSVAREWREAGVSTPRSEKGSEGWTHNGVKSILINPRNAGLNTYRGEVVGRGQWDPIFPESTHNQLRALLTDPKRLVRTTGSKGRTPVNLLSGIARCATCGETVHAASSNGRRVYKCRAEHITTPRDEADSIVISTIVNGSLISAPGLVFELPPAQDPEGIWDQIQKLNQRQETITAAFADGDLERSAWEAANASINSEKDALRASLVETENLGTNVRALHQEAVSKFATLTVPEQRAILMRLAEITLHPRNRKRNVPITKQVSMFLIKGEGEERQIHPYIAEHPDAWVAMKAGRSIWEELPPKPAGEYVPKRRTRVSEGA